MDLRAVSIVGVMAGVLIGSAIWAVSGRQAEGRALSALDARLDAISVRTREGPDRPSDALAQILARPLFASATVATPADEAAPISIQVTGVTRAPGRRAALLSIGGASAQWLSVGQEQNGVALKDVSSAGAVIVSIDGERFVPLGAAQASLAAATAPDGAPPGFKSPPPPASAPSSN